MQEADSELGAFMKARGWNQTKMAKKARVSQASVSRALKGGVPKRRGRAHLRICNCMHQEKSRKTVDPTDKGKVMQVFERIWGTSQAHADAIARVIQALDGICPPRLKEE